ncbi:HlyD family efflux transporter periplasmic adaptor subunit [Streptomyces antimicrobicus]|uniref:HlyD family efflux transporter periplasmic adaptor subunit n=1 Tax=Streptomyces antimicrobicus TaxID=2883108 RepID=A0ABS8BDV6_9ACTN|nr:HlyD family efflux transporter periplasmic adaptor subunit [Streptomyces antimicrobicus]MCB5182803.1 HlyD family efflux transporter periplasmic adaptor subunit [Streptomyces antimicrobicus]
MQFRHKALAKLQSPEELDLPVRLARPQGRLALAVTVAVIAAAAYWACTGTVSAKLTAPGVLTRAEGSYLLQSPVAGQVTAVLAEPGRLLPPGTPLLRVGTDRGEQLVRLVAAGRVTHLLARTGSVVTPGADVATVERATTADDPLVAVLYVPAAAAATIPVGAQVDVTVPSVPTQRYGVLRGRVKAVGRAPQSQAQIAGFLGDGRLAARLAGQGDPVAVLVDLPRSATTRSGYRWSSTDGPPHPLDSATPVTAAVHLTAQRPLDWLLP